MDGACKSDFKVDFREALGFGDTTLDVPDSGELFTGALVGTLARIGFLVAKDGIWSSDLAADSDAKLFSN